MKSKKTGLLLIALGMVCIIVAVCMLKNNKGTERGGKREPEHKEISSEDTAGSDRDEKEGVLSTEEDSFAASTTSVVLDHDTPVQEINADMYEWPHGNTRYANLREPDIVVYLAQRKEMFDEIVEGLNKYEGKELSAWIVWDEEEQEVGFSRTFAEDMEDDARYNLFEEFFREGMILSIYVKGDNISFEVAQNSYEFLYYYYDENRNEETDDSQENTDFVHVAPHWYWWWHEPMNEPY